MEKFEKGLVSIITPMYNGERFVAKTIESVLSQNYTKWEMIIIDDGSKDNSPIIVEEYSKRDGRIQLIRQKNAGSGILGSQFSSFLSFCRDQLYEK